MDRDRQRENIGITDDEAQILLVVIDEVLADAAGSLYQESERELLASVREKLLSHS